MTVWPSILHLLLMGAQSTAACEILDGQIDQAQQYRDEEEYRKAEARYQEVVHLAVARGCHHVRARSLNGLGVIASYEGRLHRAVNYLKQAGTVLDRSVSDNGQSLRGTVELNLGLTYFRLGWLDEASDAAKRAQTRFLRHETAPNHWAALRLLSARVARLRGQTQMARTEVRNGLEISGAKADTLSALWQEQARLDLDSGRFKAAEESLTKAAGTLGKTGDNLGKANIIADFAELEVKRGRWAECLRRTEEALGLVRWTEAKDLHLEAHARYLRSVALLRMGDTENSKLQADRGLAVLEAQRDAWRDLGIEYHALRQKYYRHRLDLAFEVDGPGAAWSVFESYRAQGLLASIGSRTGLAAKAAAPEDQDVLKELPHKILETLWQLEDPAGSDANKVRHNAVFRNLLSDLKKLQADRGSGPTPEEVGPKDISRIFDDETLPLVFARGSQKVFLLTLDSRGFPDGFSLDPGLQDLAMKADRIFQGLGPDAPAKLRSRVERDVDELSRLLLAPLGDRIDKYDRLAIVNDLPLERIPFEILRHPDTFKPLIRSHEIIYLPSISVLAAVRKRTKGCRRPGSALLAMGDPVFASHDSRWPEGLAETRNADEAHALRRLPASADEVAAIAELYPRDSVTVALGQDATRARLLAEAANHHTVHIASHARSDPEVPERSKIALSCLGAEGRITEACDVYFADARALELCGQIVVLSACDTAGGRSVAGEGIQGLPQAFLDAGASTVVASLWRVADRTTAILMKAFHRHLRDGAEPATALRLAKLELIDAGRPPAAWTAFILQGDGQNPNWSSTFSAPSGPID